MKRIAKLILLIFSAMLLTLTAFAVTSFAQDNSGVIATVTKIYPDSTVKTENITTSAKMEEALLGKSSYISVVTLKSDYNAGASSQGIDKNATVYLDLAGYKYYSITEAKAISLFTPCNSSTFYLYSSKAGGAVFNMNMNTDGGYTGHAIINYSTSYKNQTVYLGKVVDPITGVTHSGDNLSTYSSLLMDCSSKFNDNGRIYIDGGNYVRSSTGSAGLIILRDNTKVSIKNATLANTRGTSPIFTTVNATAENLASTTPMQGTVEVENCVIYTQGQLFGSVYSSDNFKLKNCYLICSVTGVSDPANYKSRIPTLIDCYVANSYNTVKLDGYVEASALERKAFNIRYNTYNYSYSASTGKYTLASSSFAINTISDNYVFTKAITTPDRVSDITWQSGSESVTETWVNGSVPTVPTSLTLPAETDTYYYSFKNVAPVDGDKTYVAEPTAKFGIKVNLTLYTDFVYNIYVEADKFPAVNYLKVNGETYEATYTEVAGQGYYVVSYPVFVSKSLDPIALDVNIDGYKETFNQHYDLSIPDYAARVLNAGYSSEVKEFINSILMYIRAAYDFIGEDSSSLGELASAPTATGTAPAAKPESLDFISGAAIYVDESVEIRFFVESGVTIPASITVSYPKDGVYTTETVSASDWYYAGNGTRCYGVKMRAKDLYTKSVEFSLGEDSWTYSLANYIYTVKQISPNSPSSLFIDALWLYAKNSARYEQTSPSVNITVDGNSLGGYVLVANTAEEIRAAEKLSAAIERITGTRLSIVSEAGTSHAIYISVLATDALNYANDFTVSVAGGNMYVSSNFKSFVEEAVDKFISESILTIDSDFDFDESYTLKLNADKFYYSDFGAVGDGYYVYNVSKKGIVSADSGGYGTDDFLPLYNAHAFANKAMRHTVYADEGATYYIHDTRIAGSVKQIIIQTNTVWEGATFIIDDETLGLTDSRYSKHVFYVAPEHSSFSATKTMLASLGKIGRDTTKIDLGLGYPALLVVYNANHRNYIRYGYDDDGQEQQELVLVDKYGNIDPSTSLLFDYEEVTGITIYRVDDTPIKLTGGNFITVASRTDSTVLTDKSGVEYRGDSEAALGLTYKENNPTDSNYSVTKKKANFSRGIKIGRSNTVLEGISYKIICEYTLEEQTKGLTGYIYTGFVGVGTCTDVTLESCELSARRYYIGGTYGLSATMANKLVLHNCTQLNYYADIQTAGNDAPVRVMSYNTDTRTGLSAYWGLAGTNYCKNFIYDSCMLTRYDAHKGVYNGKIVNSYISVINLIGGSEFLIENTTIEYPRIFNLRQDYGSTFNGTVTIKDCTLKSDSDELYIANYTYTNVEFGYKTTFPNIIINNLKVVNMNEELRTGVTVALTRVNEDSTFEKKMKNTKDPDSLIAPSANLQDERFVLSDGTVVENLNPVTPPSFITVINNLEEYGISYNLFENYAFFRDTAIEIIPVFKSEDSPFVDYENNKAPTTEEVAPE